MMSSNNYYQILGVSALAGPEEIKTAYRHLVKYYHPDTSKNPEATARFIEVQKAYQILIDPAKRKEYDKQDHRRGQEASLPDRRYAFPFFREGSSAVIDLKEISYSLSSQEASLLSQRGVLRGDKAQISKHGYYCHRCRHLWSQPLSRGSARPDRCPACRAVDWSEFLLLRCLHCSAVFESEGSLREQMIEERKGHLFTPYDLFPCCPACKQSQWCSAEETRLKALREQKEVHLKTLREQALREQEELRQRQADLDALRPASTDFNIYELPDSMPYIPYDD